MIDTPSSRKARGAFFTPPEITRFIADWALRRATDQVLEPSCGDAAFLLAAGIRLRALGAGVPRLAGTEIHPASAVVAADRLGAVGLHARLEVGDFFDQVPRPAYDAVIGNPPYIRYQDFAGAARDKGQGAALASGVRLSGLASSWAAFTVHAAQFVPSDGRLGLVLPAELLTVNYAAPVRRFLLERFATVRLVLFETLVFPEVAEEIVLLLAEGSGGATQFEVYQARDLDDLAQLQDSSWTAYRPPGDQKWTPALLPEAALQIYQAERDGPGFATLRDWGETSLGAVTGNNDFFALSQREVDRLGLASAELVKISPPGAKHLHGLAFTAEHWAGLMAEGRRGYLFAPPVDAPSAAALSYIASGESAGIDQAYKCRIRRPWWRVPRVGRPDLLFTYMNHDRPRLVTNAAEVDVLNSLYGITLKPALRPLGRAVLPSACLNSLTLLGAELVGRAYGGGLLKHEPREADRVPVPSAAVLAAVAHDLGKIRPGDDATEQVDRIVLERQLGLTPAEIAALRAARAVLFRRRVARARAIRPVPD